MPLFWLASAGSGERRIGTSGFMNWRSLLGFSLLWIAWAAIITAIMVLTGIDWTLLAIALLFLAVAAALIFGARALTPAWYRQLTIVAGVYGLVSLVRAAADRERAAELLVVAALSLTWCALLEIVRRVRRRYLV